MKALVRRLDRSTWPAWIKDPEGRYLVANRALAGHLGVVRAALRGRPDAVFWSERLAGRFRVDDHAALARGRAIAVPEFDSGADGFLVTLKLPLRREDGTAVGTAGFFAPAGHDGWVRTAERLYADFVSLLGNVPGELGLTGHRAGIDPDSFARRPLRSPDVPGWLLDVRERLVSDLPRCWTVKGLANDAGVHPGHLGRAFRRAFGSGVHAFLRRRRVERACVELLTTERTAGEIALATGFCDQSHFTREFRRVTGVTPGSYRRVDGSRVESVEPMPPSKDGRP